MNSEGIKDARAAAEASYEQVRELAKAKDRVAELESLVRRGRGTEQARRLHEGDSDE